MNYNYGDAYLRHPCDHGTVCFSNGSALRVHDIAYPLPEFMRQADMIFCDPPWNKGNLTCFYTKADEELRWECYLQFYDRLFDCISEISPKVLYLEIGKEYLAEFLMRCKELYPYVTFYNSTYYHRPTNLCYIIRASRKAAKPKYDGMDEEDLIDLICKEEQYECVGDMCMGQGLVAQAAAKYARRFVGTELNHKRLSVAIERVVNQGYTYEIKE